MEEFSSLRRRHRVLEIGFPKLKVLDEPNGLAIDAGSLLQVGVGLAIRMWASSANLLTSVRGLDSKQAERKMRDKTDG